MGIFRKTAPAEPLGVTMAGVKLGQRLLVVGVRDAKLIAQLAIKAGLTGRACVVDDDDGRLKEAAAAIEREGALIEATAAACGDWPYDRDSFDVVVITQPLAGLRADLRVQCALDALRVLRPGGRALIVEPARRGGFGALLHKQAVDASYPGAVATLQQAGFAAVRRLADADGVTYVEGIKRA